jgi:hypothetical protein
MLIEALPVNLQERFEDIVRQLSGSHWTSMCVVTISKFNTFFVGREEAHAALCYLSQRGKARYLVVRKEDPLEVHHFYCPFSAVLLQQVPYRVLT